jgi:Kef-type K+ transport system membrane component KefB
MAEIEKAYQKAVLGGAVFVLILILAILTIVKFSVGEIDRDAFGPLVFVLSWMAVALFFTNLLFARYRRSVTEQTTARLSQEIPLSRDNEQVR